MNKPPITPDLPKIKVNHKYTLPCKGTWKKSVHVFDQRTVNAVLAAWTAERPLLIRGDPGTGKSQLGRAVAEALDWLFISEVVSTHTEIQDLWFRFDAVNRLGQAQILGAANKHYEPDEITAQLNPELFLSPGVLWWAFDWKTAAKFYQRSQSKHYHPNPAQKSEALTGVVLLIDEIDKADAELPNSLLETLDNSRFRIPWINESIGYREEDEEAIRPLVIITTNEDRQLPPAFVRRCLVLNLELPEKKPALFDFLIKRGNEHFTDAKGQPLFSKDVLKEVADQLYKDRLKADELGFKPPGQAEYLDMLRVLSRMAESEQEQLSLLSQIKDFALKKYPGMQQQQEETSE